MPKSLVIHNMVGSVKDSQIQLPYKIWKTLLLQSSGLPLDETFIFSTHTLSEKGILYILNKVGKLLKKYRTVVIRTAWTPHRIRSPWFIIYNKSQLKSVLKKLARLAKKEKEFTHLLIHSDVANPDDSNDKYNYISGRLLLHPVSEIPLEKTIELIYGEYYPALFDDKGFNFENDRRTARYIKKLKQGWYSYKKSPYVTKRDAELIIKNIKKIDGKLNSLREILAATFSTNPNSVCVVVDFITSKSSDKVFITYDFDCVVSKV